MEKLLAVMDQEIEIFKMCMQSFLIKVVMKLPIPQEELEKI